MTLWRLAAGTTGVIAAGMLCTAMVAVVPELGVKTAVMGGFLVLLLAGAMLSGHPKEVFLVGYILSLTYNRQYFSFDGLLGSYGSNSLYWVPADPFLLLLLGVSAWEALTGRSTAWRHPPGAPLGAGPVLPFLAVCCVSSLLALRPDWAFNDLFRVVKFTVLLIWLHHNLTPRLWLVAVVTLGASTGLQAALGVVQVMTKAGAGLLGMVGLGTEFVDAATDIENRARGTMGHPNYLAPYLLLLAPAAFAAALFSRVPWIKLACLAVTLIASAGMVASASRSPIAITALVLAAVAAIGVWQRVLSAKVALGCGILALGIVGVMALAYADRIMERLEGDLTASVDFRLDYNRAALAIWNDHPLLGIGPNNSILELGRHAPLFVEIIQGLDKYRDTVNVRAAPVHNVYLLFLSETGALGLAAFLLLVAGVMWRGLRGAVASEGAVRGLCIGAVVGLAGQLIQQTVDFSLWYDPSWYTLAIVAGLLGAVPQQAARIG